MILCAMFDSVGQIHTHPLHFPSVAAGVRAFSDSVNGGDKSITAHPGDYSFWELGSYDEKTGIIVPLSAPRRIVMGSELVKAS